MPRARRCQEKLNRFKSGRSRSVGGNLTDVETFFLQYYPKTKSQASILCFPEAAPLVKVTGLSDIPERKWWQYSFEPTGTLLQLLSKIKAQLLQNETPQSVTTQMRPRQWSMGILLHHDDASTHSANITLSFVEDAPLKSATHPPNYTVESVRYLTPSCSQS